MVNVLATGATTLERDVIVSIKIEVEVRDVVQCHTPRSCNICACFLSLEAARFFLSLGDCNVCLCAV